jgi:hypothetical protein
MFARDADAIFTGIFVLAILAVVVGSHQTGGFIDGLASLVNKLVGVIQSPQSK